MANHKSAEKRIRQTLKKTQRNRFYKTKMKNIIKAVREAVSKNDINAASDALKIANKNLHKFVSKGILTKNAAARKVSRLNASVKNIAKS